MRSCPEEPWEGAPVSGNRLCWEGPGARVARVVFSHQMLPRPLGPYPVLGYALVLPLERMGASTDRRPGGGGGLLPQSGALERYRHRFKAWWGLSPEWSPGEAGKVRCSAPIPLPRSLGSFLPSLSSVGKVASSAPTARLGFKQRLGCQDGGPGGCQNPPSGPHLCVSGQMKSA